MNNYQLISEIEAKNFEAIMNRIARAMDGFHWQYEGIVEAIYSKDFKKQECESGAFEYEYVAQYGDGDFGYRGDILFPMCGKFIKIHFWD